MKIAVAKEIDAGEPRVAAVPDTVKKFKSIGAEVAIEPGAGMVLTDNSARRRDENSLPSQQEAELRSSITVEPIPQPYYTIVYQKWRYGNCYLFKSVTFFKIFILDEVKRSLL